MIYSKKHKTSKQSLVFLLQAWAFKENIGFKSMPRCIVAPKKVYTAFPELSGIEPVLNISLGTAGREFSSRFRSIADWDKRFLEQYDYISKEYDYDLNDFLKICSFFSQGHSPSNYFRMGGGDGHRKIFDGDINETSEKIFDTSLRFVD